MFFCFENDRHHFEVQCRNHLLVSCWSDFHFLKCVINSELTNYSYVSQLLFILLLCIFRTVILLAAHISSFSFSFHTWRPILISLFLHYKMLFSSTSAQSYNCWRTWTKLSPSLTVGWLSFCSSFSCEILRRSFS